MVDLVYDSPLKRDNAAAEHKTFHAGQVWKTVSRS